MGAGEAAPRRTQRKISENLRAECLNSRNETSEAEDHDALERSDGKQRLRLSNFRFLMILVGFGMAFVGSQVCPLIFAAIITAVTVDLDGASNLVWVFSSSLVAMGVVAPFAGPLADLLGRKTIAIVGVLSSMVGMILCAATPNVSGFIVGQTFAGIGMALEELLSISAVLELVPRQQRGFYAALLVSTFLPFAPASLYGGLIAQSNWRYCACLIAVWNLITAVIIAIFYNPPPRTNSTGLSRRDIFRRIDYFGGFLLTAGIVLFMIGLNWAGQTYSWRSAHVIALVTTGGCLICLFLAYEMFWAPYPMFPGRLLQYPRTFIALMVVILMAGVNYIPVLYFWIMQSISVYGSNQFQAGIRTLPFGFCILGGGVISALMISIFKSHVRSIMTTFCVLQATAIGCMAAVDPHNINTVWAPLVLGLLSVGGVLIPNQIIITLISPDDLIATATCLTVCLRAIGQVVGVSIFYNQFISVMTKNAYTYVLPAALEIGIFNTTTIENMLPSLIAVPFSEYVATIPQADTPQKINILHEAVIQAFGHSFPRVYYISIAFGATACIASMLMGDLSKLMDAHIAVQYF
ncbi:fungal trichothecene efflux pump [Talaromyces proteolyticus]|uniref:Fungal trichothecene efflux pump n=1 Tax=Talaromyces proteolyticus TaxID=1131652 RepID=A0AAD4PVM3_9EURO|nr:fungal trichothecene efflux pump [Talaromyces proteolyticus]KAH8690520.1 fungal trichothecene efflux pump [Talaromyces proteolyticus]